MNKAQINSLVRELFQSLDRISPQFERQEALLVKLHDEINLLFAKVDVERSLRFAAVEPTPAPEQTPA